MTSQEFKDTLVLFFKEHDPGAVRAVPRIVKAFSDRQEEVFKYLEDRYNVKMEISVKRDSEPLAEPGSADNIGGHMPDADQGAEPF